jgi:hypothetical protein
MSVTPPYPRRLRREQPIQKAARLIAESRVHLTAAQVYMVDGDSGSYRVIAAIDGIYCPCEARTPLCSHALAVAHAREAAKPQPTEDDLEKLWKRVGA